VTALFLALAVFGTAVSCTKRGDSGTSADNQKSATGAAGKDAENREVHLAIWANYLSPEMQLKFTESTGIKIRVSNYSSNEELLAKVQAGATGIDVAVPSDYMVEVMTKSGFLRPLDLAKIPNKDGLAETFLKQEYDPENRFSLPYAWTTAGIAVNRDLFKGPIKGWKDLFTQKELNGKIALLDDARETIALALKYNGFSVNTAKPEELNKAKETLKELRGRVKMFRSDSIDPLVNKEIIVAHAYSPDALQAARKSNGKIEYILPEEGGTRAIDNVVILKNAKNVEEAHALINFLLSREANVSFVKSVFGGPVVVATKDLLPKELQDNASLFPAAGTLSKFERIRDIGEATRAYDRLWTEIKSE
jgi:spermidine/putrescine transport system substrate-binding protein